MSDYIFEKGKGQIAYINGGRAFDKYQRARYLVEGGKLLDLQSGEVMGHLGVFGKPGMVSTSGLFD